MTTTISERQTFLNAIIANPDDDLPRLVYADWLEEHGEDERAEFIRKACWDKHGNQYTGTAELVRLYRPHVILPSCIPNDVVLTVCRGFIHSVHVPTLGVWRGSRTCDRCQGWSKVARWEYGDHKETKVCPTCSGSGRISGIGRELCRWHPVQEVRVGDRKPWPSQTSWSWWKTQNRTQQEEFDLPGEVFDLLDGHDRVGRFYKRYPTAAGANAAHSRALILEARQPEGVTK